MPEQLRLSLSNLSNDTVHSLNVLGGSAPEEINILVIIIVSVVASVLICAIGACVVAYVLRRRKQRLNALQNIPKGIEVGKAGTDGSESTIDEWFT